MYSNSIMYNCERYYIILKSNILLATPIVVLQQCLLCFALFCIRAHPQTFSSPRPLFIYRTIRIQAYRTYRSTVQSTMYFKQKQCFFLYLYNNLLRNCRVCHALHARRYRYRIDGVSAGMHRIVSHRIVTNAGSIVRRREGRNVHYQYSTVAVTLLAFSKRRIEQPRVRISSTHACMQSVHPAR